MQCLYANFCAEMAYIKHVHRHEASSNSSLHTFYAWTTAPPERVATSALAWHEGLLDVTRGVIELVGVLQQPLCTPCLKSKKKNSV